MSGSQVASEAGLDECSLDTVQTRRIEATLTAWRFQLTAQKWARSKDFFPLFLRRVYFHLPKWTFCDDLISLDDICPALLARGLAPRQVWGHLYMMYDLWARGQTFSPFSLEDHSKLTPEICEAIIENNSEADPIVVRGSHGFQYIHQCLTYVLQPQEPYDIMQADLVDAQMAELRLMEKHRYQLGQSIVFKGELGERLLRNWGRCRIIYQLPLPDVAVKRVMELCFGAHRRK
jgi:hypothetical protein